MVFSILYQMRKFGGYLTKSLFFDNDAPFDDFRFVALYDRIENRIVYYNTLYLDLSLAQIAVEEMLKDNPTENSRLGIRSKNYAL